MASNNPNIKAGVQPEWLKKHSFAVKPANRNHTGVKRSLVSILKEAKTLGVEAELNKKQLAKIYKLILNLSAKDIKRIANDKESPIAVVVVCQMLLDEKLKRQAFEFITTQLFGKAPEEVRVTTTTDEVTPEEREEIMKIVGKKYG